MRVNRESLIEVGYDEGYLPNSTVPITRFTIDTNCGDILFVNNSDINGGGGFVVLIGQMPLRPGASIVFGVNAGEIQTKTLYVTTPSPVLNAGVYVFKKQYM